MRRRAPSASDSPRRAGAAHSAGVLWLVGLAMLTIVGAGFGVMWRYERAPGPAASVPPRWPANAPFALAQDRPTLILFAHPHCPCTRATIGELDHIVARCRERLHTVVYFLADPRRGDAWTRTDLWTSVARIPGVEIRTDPGAAIAASFGVWTSGHALLYAADGRLLFDGGITDARGHAGDNVGEESIGSWVLDGASKCVSTPVYGCLLRSNSLDDDDGDPP